MFLSRFMPCSDCGESLERSATVAHSCKSEHLADYQMFALRDDTAKFDARLRLYLHTAAGRFEVWLAAREVRKGA